MKSLKSISLAITMLISFVAFGQEKDSITNLKSKSKKNVQVQMCCQKIEIEALIIIDGIVINSKTLENINPNTIESINVIKGEKAFLLCGEKGKNGAIIITTKNLSRKEKRYLKRQSKIELQIQEYQKAKANNLKN
jgi:hypothetical protein